MTGVVFDPLRDKSYRATTLGRDVADFLAWKELGGASPRTLDQYERDLSRGALMFPDKSVATLEDGDAWIIRGVKGEVYPCKPDIFEATYELVADLGLIEGRA